MGGFLKKLTMRAYTLPMAIALCRKRRRQKHKTKNDFLSNAISNENAGTNRRGTGKLS